MPRLKRLAARPCLMSASVPCVMSLPLKYIYPQLASLPPEPARSAHAFCTIASLLDSAPLKHCTLEAPYLWAIRLTLRCRFRLPTGLPPTFKGSSLRFTYGIEVRAVYELRTGACCSLSINCSICLADFKTRGDRYHVQRLMRGCVRAQDRCSRQVGSMRGGRGGECCVCTAFSSSDMPLCIPIACRFP